MKTNFKNVSFKCLAACLSVLALLVIVTPATKTFAHGGEIEVGGGGTKGPVQLSAQQQKSIGLEVAAVDFRPLSELLKLNGELALLPDHQASVSPRISGQIKELYVGLGDNVKAGEKLARVQSRQVGDPPPTVDVIAPISGVIDSVNVQLGQSVEPANSLYQISNRSQLNLVAKLYEEDLAKVALGQAASVSLLSYHNQFFKGVVKLLAPTLDPQTRTLDVWVRIDNPDGLLRPHLYGQAHITLKNTEDALAIPNNAILEDNGERFVFLRNGTKYERVDIQTGFSDDQFTEVKEGLVPGDEVVTQGLRELYTLWLTGGKPVSNSDGD